MITYSCDVCGKRMEKDDPQTRGWELERKRLKIHISRAIDGNWDEGQVCFPCIRDTILAATKDNWKPWDVKGEIVKETRREVQAKIFDAEMWPVIHAVDS